MKRDTKNLQELRRLGWNVLIIWTCEIKDTEQLQKKLKSFLTPI